MTTSSSLQPDLAPLREWNDRLVDGFPVSFDWAPKQQRNIHTRIAHAAAFSVPYLKKLRPDIEGLTCLEVGCGMGAKSLAIAETCRRYIGIDIDADQIERARQLGRALGSPAEFLVRPADGLRELLAETKPDIVILYAVLEHLTISERLTMLRDVWELLQPGALVYVGETPNRLTHVDYHSSHLPYFTMIPPELAAEVYELSPRKEWPTRVQQHDSVELGLHRRGHAVSFHEFWAVTGRTRGFPECNVVADGFEQSVLNWKSWRLAETHFLEQFTYLNGGTNEKVDFQLHPTFARFMLNFVLEKPPNGIEPTSRPSARMDHVRMITAPDGERDWLGNPRCNAVHGLRFDISAEATSLQLGIHKLSLRSKIAMFDGDSTEPMLEVEPSDYDQDYLDVCDSHIFIPVPVPTSGELRVKSDGRVLVLGVLERRPDQL